MKVEDLVCRAQQGDKVAFQEVVERYKPYVIKNAQKYYIYGMEMEDFISEGYVSIASAIRKYDKSKNSSFTPYVNRAIQCNFYNIVRKNCRYNNNVSMQLPLSENMNLEDVFEDQFNIEDDYTHKEDLSLLKEVMDKLSSEEIDDIYCFFNTDGITFKQIAEDRKIGYSALIKQKNDLFLKVKRLFESMN